MIRFLLATGAGTCLTLGAAYLMDRIDARLRARLVAAEAERIAAESVRITTEAALIVERETSAMLGHMLHLAHMVEAHPSCTICDRERVSS